MGENSEKYIAFTVPFKKDINNYRLITYRLKFIDSFRLFASSLSNLVNNLVDQLYSKCSHCNNLLHYMLFKNNQIVFRCFECKKNIIKSFNNELTENFQNRRNQFCKNDKNKLLLLLRKGDYPYEYMDSWNKFNDDQASIINNFYCELTMENITNSDYRHAQRVLKMFNNKNLGDYHDLYVQCDVLLLSDVFQGFRRQCLKIYDLDPAYYLTLPGLAWEACLKTTGVKLDLITDQKMLLMVEEGIRGRITQVITKSCVANNKYMQKIMIKMKSHHFFSILM